MRNEDDDFVNESSVAASCARRDDRLASLWRVSHIASVKHSRKRLQIDIMEEFSTIWRKRVKKACSFFRSGEPPVYRS